MNRSSQRLDKSVTSCACLVLRASLRLSRATIAAQARMIVAIAVVFAAQSGPATTTQAVTSIATIPA
jgi:hypothetical protein